MNIGVQRGVPLWLPIFKSSGHIPKSGISRLYSSSMFNYLRNCWTVVYSCTILCSHQQQTRIPILPLSHRNPCYFLGFVFFFWCCFLFLFFYVHHFLNLHWICYNIASILCSGFFFFFLAKRHLASFFLRNQTHTLWIVHTLWIGRQSCNHWTTREVLGKLKWRKSCSDFRSRGAGLWPASDLPRHCWDSVPSCKHSKPDSTLDKKGSESWNLLSFWGSGQPPGV